ncbi:hypothetical protein B0H14DRAFT_2828711 [Mycena olivaceomarginata]|nr:hypothetical protein B0H14DRAFT_2828711 [Mycena olivaceomarginata]
MRALTSFPLNNDIVAHIMACCFTFNTLHSTILICKAFYGVFQAHPKSITRAMAYNIVGPALPQALRMLRYPYPVDNEYISIDPIALAMACPEDPDYSDVLFTAEEKLYLEEDSRTVAALEDIYSLTFKDPTSNTSVLISEDLKWVEILLSAGPATVLDAWKEQDYSVLREDLGFEPLVDENKLFSGYFSCALESIWESRKVTSRTLV